MTEAHLQDKVVRPDYWAFVGICHSGPSRHHSYLAPWKPHINCEGYEAHRENTCILTHNNDNNNDNNTLCIFRSWPRFEGDDLIASDYYLSSSTIMQCNVSLGWPTSLYDILEGLLKSSYCLFLISTVIYYIYIYTCAMCTILLDHEWWPQQQRPPWLQC